MDVTKWLHGKGLWKGIVVFSVCAMIQAGAETNPTKSIFQIPLKWLNDRGSSVSLSQWEGDRVVLTMFYTECQLKCGRTMDILSRMQKRYDEKSEEVDFIIISLNPKKDTPKRLARYRKARKLTRENWHFLTGKSKKHTDMLAQLLGINYVNMDPHIIHDFLIYVLDESGEIEHTIDWNTDVDEIF